ncbi:MAG: radical SAM protein [SAR202 cluster bacterium]|nr:radical SAM protein [SAR202 cluster bacterium]
MAHIIFGQEMYFALQSTQVLSAYLKNAGHTTDVAIGSPAEIVEYCRKEKPDIIAFSVLTSYRNHMLATVDELKESKIDSILIAGGYDITFMPQILSNSNLDIICVGEGGDSIVELCNALDEGKNWRDLDIGNLHIKQTDGTVKKNPMRYWMMHMDEIPFDDRDIYWKKDSYFEIVPFTQVLAGRGCPYPCTYCFNDGYKKIHIAAGMKSKDYTNLRSVKHVIEELKMLEEKYGSRFFFFNDSTLTYNPKWIIEFCNEFIKAGIKAKFSINAVIPELTEEVCKALANTKKVQLIRFGLETGNEEFRYKTLRKNVKNSQMIEVTDRMNKYGLRYSMQFMLGLPGETKELAWESINMARKITGPKGVHGINIFKPFPGLEINNIGLELGQYQASDVLAPGSVTPSTLRKESFKDPDGKSEVILPADEAYAASRQAMHKTGKNAENVHNSGYNYGKNVFGSIKMVYYDNYRRDKLGLYVLKLSRYSHLLIRFPGAKKIIEKIIDEFPDNAFNRMVWKVSESLLNIRVHADVPFSFIMKYFLFHRNKQIR